MKDFQISHQDFDFAEQRWNSPKLPTACHLLQTQGLADAPI